jgi:outer membrane protein
MKQTFKLIALVAVILTLSFSANAQKFGHINFQQLIQVMPESIAAQETLKQFAAELEGQYTAMQQELQTKSQEYVAQMEGMTATIRQAKESDLQALQQRIQTFGQGAQQEVQQKEQEILAPIFEKARTALSEVAKEQSLLYVFEVNGLLYHSAESVDMFPLVKTKLGVQ